MSEGDAETMDWVAWHRSYGDSESSLSRRLAVVRRRIGEALDTAAGPGAVRILSLCAGDGRDLLPELAARPSLRATTTLIETNERLVASARDAASVLDGVQVRRGDAGDLATLADVLPVDLLLLCGIFGNISTADIRATVAAVPSMVAAGPRSTLAGRTTRSGALWQLRRVRRGRHPVGSSCHRAGRRRMVPTGISAVARAGIAG